MMKQLQLPQSCDLDSPIRTTILKSLLQELSSASVGCAAEGDPFATRPLGGCDDSLTQKKSWKLEWLSQLGIFCFMTQSIPFNHFPLELLNNFLSEIQDGNGGPHAYQSRHRAVLEES